MGEVRFSSNPSWMTPMASLHQNLLTSGIQQVDPQLGAQLPRGKLTPILLSSLMRAVTSCLRPRRQIKMTTSLQLAVTTSRQSLHLVTVGLGVYLDVDKLRFPMVPMRRKLLPISEVLRRRGECEIAIVPGSFQACVVQNRASGPVRIACPSSSTYAVSDWPRDWC